MELFWNTVNQYAAQGVDFRFIINYNATEAFLCREDDTEEHPEFFLQIHNNPPLPSSLQPLTVVAPNYALYQQCFHKAQTLMAQHHVKVINLTMSTPIQSPYTLQEIFTHTSARYKVYAPKRFVCFSPEPFIRITPSGQITCTPMKGTINASIPQAEQRILANPKEIEEHNAIITLTQHDLQSIASQVHVTRYRYIEPLHTNRGKLLQVSSQLSAQLSPTQWPSKLGTLLHTLLPASSISGTPKEAAHHIIQACEPTPRGFYTGICGRFAQGALDTGVMIRFIREESPHTLYFHSGGGITHASDCQSEYNEILAKIYLP